jgi:predicted metal-dependent HD superfamily phosphohydrolase
LGMIPEIYREYSIAIRREYAWIADRDYCFGRKTVLEGFVQRPAIFQSDIFKTPFAGTAGLTWEVQARTNIAAEIAQIDASLRTLPP